MTVYFVHRCHDEGPTEKGIKVFEDDDSVLEWFQKRWMKLAHADEEVVGQQVSKEMGRAIYGLERFFQAITEQALSLPESMEQLSGALQEPYLRLEGEVICESHLIQITVNDYYQDLAYYFFDDQFLEKNFDLVEFLLHKDWQLPSEYGAGDFAPYLFWESERIDARREAGTIFPVFLSFYAADNFDFSGLQPIHNVTLPNLCSFLTSVVPGKNFPFELKVLRSQLLFEEDAETLEEKAFIKEILANPQEIQLWSFYSDWLSEAGSPTANQVMLTRAFKRLREIDLLDFADKFFSADFLNSPLADTRAESNELISRNPKSTASPEKAIMNVEQHMAQLTLNVHSPDDGQDLYHQWIFFDNYWASAHPNLANGILRFASRWDVLTR